MLREIDVTIAEKVIRYTAARDILAIRRVLDFGTWGWTHGNWILGYYQGLLTGLQNEANTLKLRRTEETINRLGDILRAATGKKQSAVSRAKRS